MGSLSSDFPVMGPSHPDHAVLERSFEPLHEELAAWQAAGLAVRFWLRDDDLIGKSENFSRFCALTRKAGATTMCSVIPAQLDEDFLSGMEGDDHVLYVQHGYAHVNHEPEGVPKSEFGPVRPIAHRIRDIRAGAHRLERVLGSRFVKVFVPPWNRMADDLAQPLLAMGFQGASQYGLLSEKRKLTNLGQINAHVDILNWGLASTQRARPAAQVALALAAVLRTQRLAGRTLPEPIGILSHHCELDAHSWQVLAYLLWRLQGLWCEPKMLLTSL